MLDQYIMGRVQRISPEAPVPVVEERSRKHIPGGAGNVICNLHSIGAEAVPVGLIGQDEEGRILKSDMENYTKIMDGLLEISWRPTTVKTRVFASNQQVCRIDREDKTPVRESVLEALLEKIKEFMEGTSGIILSDYDKGVMVPDLIAETVRIAHQRNIFVSVDPQVTHFERYRKVDVLTPNHIEAGRFLNRTLVTDEEVTQGGREIIDRLEAKSVLITRGEKGMTLVEPGRSRHFPTVAREVFDVTGAGDTVISIFTAIMAAGGSLQQAVQLSNAAAGIVVGRIGAATVSVQELRQFNLSEVQSAG